jgi:hypothetical protein
VKWDAWDVVGVLIFLCFFIVCAAFALLLVAIAFHLA